MTATRRIPAALALAAAALVLASCSTVSSGRITEKTHSDPSEYTYYIDHCVSYREDGTCSVNVPMPRTQQVPEKWGFDLVNGDEEGSVSVSEDTWNRYDVGDYYEKGGRGR